MTPIIPTPRIVNRDDLSALATRVNALSQMLLTARIEGTPVTGVVRIDGNRASIDIDLSGLTIEGYSPANADTLAELDTDFDGTLLFDGQRIGANGLTQSDVAWSSSIVVSLTGDKVRQCYLAGATAITFTDLAAARECYLILRGGAADYALTFQTGIVWPESGAAPTYCAAGKTMVLHIYSSGTAASGIIATRNGGY